jgi:16S rRNA (guanine1207-N2)-methyltransferase
MKQVNLPNTLLSRLRPPLAVVLGSPREAAELIATANLPNSVAYQMDLYQADRLRAELDECGRGDQVITSPDLWDLPGDFQTVLYPAPKGGERDLKIDMVEQAFHLLRPRGTLLVLSPFSQDQLFANLLKKVFGRVHADTSGEGSVFWGHRDGDRPRRRHEMTFHARVGEGSSLRFLSRPGVFAYGRFDDGARALVETMTIEPGDWILDAGCGCGTNGIFAGLRAGPTGRVTFVDSNVRAVALAEHNARANGLPTYDAVASSTMAGGAEANFNVALANPPYFAQLSIAELFIRRSRALLRRGGRFFLVTKQPDQVGPIVAEAFGPAQVIERRGYVVLCARVP